MNNGCISISPAVKEAGAEAGRDKTDGEEPDGCGKDMTVAVHSILIRMVGGIYNCIIMTIHTLVDFIAYAVPEVRPYS